MVKMNDIEAVEQLEKSDQYRVIKRLKTPDRYRQGEPATPRIGIALDVEATGLDTGRDKIIELGFVAFEYDAASGLIYRVLHSYCSFEDPQEPLQDHIRRITGIDDDMLRGQRLDDDEINLWLEKSDLIIAHNAAYDRRMVERRLPQARKANWACTMFDIDWPEEGVGSLKLDYIAYLMGYFFEGHRAVNDAEATLQMLASPLPGSGRPAMAVLLERARGFTRRFFAVGAPFERKDELRTRGYRWMPDVVYHDHGKRKKGVWSRAVGEVDMETEGDWLSGEVYGGRQDMFVFSDISAQERYSVRELEID